MKIAANSIVSFHYTLSDDQGNQLETSHSSEPVTYLHGADNIIHGLENALLGKSTGERVQVRLEPQDAYGLRNSERTQRVPIKHLLYEGKLRAGMAVQLNTSDGHKAVTVIKAGRHSATVDCNHPLAGQTLNFDIEIIDLRPATAEEIAHRHVHGPGGHQH